MVRSARHHATGVDVLIRSSDRCDARRLGEGGEQGVKGALLEVADTPRQIGCRDAQRILLGVEGDSIVGIRRLFCADDELIDVGVLGEELCRTRRGQPIGSERRPRIWLGALGAARGSGERQGPAKAPNLSLEIIGEGQRGGDQRRLRLPRRSGVVLAARGDDTEVRGDLGFCSRQQQRSALVHVGVVHEISSDEVVLIADSGGHDRRRREEQPSVLDTARRQHIAFGDNIE